MTMWKPQILRDGVRSMYVAVADAIEEDVRTGRLAPGQRLPTHRQLGDRLGVAVGTVSRGYAEAERRGLISGEVGRGTFVASRASSIHGWADGDAADLVDLSLSLPPALGDAWEARRLADSLRAIADDPAISELLRFRLDSALPSHRRAGAKWIEALGLNVEPADVLVTAGAQHGLSVALSAALKPGDTLLTAALTYPGIKALGRMLQARLRDVALDDEGIEPAALEAACCREPRPAALYLVPTIQNPTGGIMSPARRQAIADIAVRHDLLVLEDEVHAPLLETRPTPLAALIPDRTIYFASVSKTIAPALRVGFLVAPGEYRQRLLAGIRTTMWTVPPLMVEITSRWIDDGTADEIVSRRRAEARTRQELARTILGPVLPLARVGSFFAWCPLPEPWRSDEFVQQARQRGVLVAGSGAFAVGRQPVPHAVRISLGMVERTELKRGLSALAEILRGAVDPYVSVV